MENKIAVVAIIVSDINAVEKSMRLFTTLAII